MAAGLSAKEIERAKFVFSIYDFEGINTLDGFELGKALQALDLTPTDKSVESWGGQKKRGVKKFQIEEFLTVFSEAKKDKDKGNMADFQEVLKLYDKSDEGNMIYDELKQILMTHGDRLDLDEVQEILKDCADPPDEDGFTTYQTFLNKLVAGPACYKIDD